MLQNYRSKKKLDKVSRETLPDATMDHTHWERLIKCNARHNQVFVERDKKGQSSHREAVTIRAVRRRLYKSHFLHSQRLLCRQSQTATTIMPHPPPASPGDNCQGGSRERMCFAIRHLPSQQTHARAPVHVSRRRYIFHSAKPQKYEAKEPNF